MLRHSLETLVPGVLCVILVLVGVLDTGTNAFNLSPKPNIVLREPISQSKTSMPKIRSSYFGFSLNLKQNSVIIGAPRAQSTLSVQRSINETGAIYKCSLDRTDEPCAPFVFDVWGNTMDSTDQFTYNNEKKDHQWLGAAMDGNANDGDKLVVCAPRIIADIPNHYLMNGICYWTSNTSTTRPLDIQRIASLRLRDNQQKFINGERFFYHMFGEQGVSVHVTDNNEEILIGAPGIFTWKGSVVRHKARSVDDFGGLSRRDVDHSPSRSMRRRHRRDTAAVEYASDIPNPLTWDQDDYSYFGFAVSSGYFDGPQSAKLLYVATAPQANRQQGEAYIFDIVPYLSTADKTIKIHYKFGGQQFGEYFGYSVLAEDFDGDNYTDIAIGAPYNAKDGTSENGAVYIYRNHGSASKFVLDKVLRTDYELSGRFGTTLSKVGDINQDGFKDLIVGAPFEGNGAVYVYFGSANGLPEKPSQRIAAAAGEPGVPQQMFGHGLSKGADIDDNQYLDIAVGAPNGEKVYIYKAYPVIKINAKVMPFSNEIQTTDRSFKFNVCWSYETRHPVGFDVRIDGTITLDGQLGRATFIESRNQFQFSKPITAQQQCMTLEAFVQFSIADIFKPIDIEFGHTVVNGIPNATLDANEVADFCETCVAVNPNDLKSTKNKIVFSTGCKGARCIADLSVQSVLANVPRPYVLGSTTSIPIEYRVQNIGETAYLARIEITLPETGVAFMKIPSNCKLNETIATQNVMECDLNGGTPMFNGDRTSFQVNIDTTKLDGSELLITALVKSASDDSNESNNRIDDVIALKSFSEVEVFGDSLKRRITLENKVETENLTHTFEIRNNGPSNIKSLDVFISVPISYLNPWSLDREELIDLKSISIKSMHKNQQFNVEWTQNNTIIILDAVVVPTPLSNVPVTDYNGMQFDTSRIGLDYNLNGDDPTEAATSDRRRRRRRTIDADTNDAYYNLYTQSVVDRQQMERFPWSNMATAGSRPKRDIFSTDDRVLANLPANRTIYFDCENEEREMCVVGKFTVPDFATDNSPIMVTLNFTINLDRLASILSEKRDIFVIRTSADFSDSSDEDISRIHVTQNYPFTIVSKYVITSTPFWVYGISIILGVLSLILLSYALYRFGFFNRGKRDELVEMKRRSQAQSYYPNEDDDLYST